MLLGVVVSGAKAKFLKRGFSEFLFWAHDFSLFWFVIILGFFGLLRT